MSDIERKPVKIMETVLRDAHQSLIATRMPIEQMLPIIDTMDKVGYAAVECWGGATFDSCLRFLKEDPWVRLRKLKEGFKNTPLQMLLRGQNLLGYSHYADDVVESFVAKSIENGIDIIRIFDCLNDLRNLETSVKACKKYGGKAQIALSYTLGGAYDDEYWKRIAGEIEALGADSLCIKDMAGLLLPYEADKLVRALKSGTKIPIELHTHYTSGVASMTYMKAIEAGVDIIDTALSPFSDGTSQPTTEAFNYALKGTKYDPKLNQDALDKAAATLSKAKQKYLDNGTLNPKSLGVNPNILKYQVPGGMLSNLMSQLKAQGAMDKYDEVLKEVPRVRKDMGYPPLVTPLSQMVGTQAVMNVITGERYKMVPKEIKEYLHGNYGAAPAPVDETIKKQIIGDDEVITCRPADLIAPEFEALKEKYKDLAKTDEDVLSIALFENVAIKFLEEKYNPRPKIEAIIDEFNLNVR
jgi:oxaloacetate decarboxylase alpha subunit